jgi:hypothetical protein
MAGTSTSSRDVTLIIEVGPGTFKDVALRNDLDVVCDDDFISRQVLESYGMDMAKLVQIPESDRRARIVPGLDGSFTPQEVVVLNWRKGRDDILSLTSGTFFVLDDPPFDIVISSQRFTSIGRTNLATSSLRMSFSRYVSKGLSAPPPLRRLLSHYVNHFRS